MLWAGLLAILALTACSAVPLSPINAIPVRPAQIFEPSGIQAALQKAASPDGVVLATLANLFVIRAFLTVQLASIKKYSSTDWRHHYIVISPRGGDADKAACDELEGPTCIEDDNLPDNKQHSQAISFASPEYFQAIYRKAAIMAAVVKYGYTGVFLDYDVVFLGDLVPYLLSIPNPILMYPDRCFSPRWVNTGIFLVRPPALAALEAWVRKQERALETLSEVKRTRLPMNYVDQAIFSKRIMRSKPFRETGLVGVLDYRTLGMPCYAILPFHAPRFCVSNCHSLHKGINCTAVASMWLSFHASCVTAKQMKLDMLKHVPDFKNAAMNSSFGSEQSRLPQNHEATLAGARM